MIILAFIVLLVLLVWLVVGARGPWWLKAIFTIAVLGFTLVGRTALNSYRGYPVGTKPPTHSIYVASEVFQPDPQHNDPGEIYLWVVPLQYSSPPLGYRPSQGEPRAYRLPYSEQLQQVLAKAQAAQRPTGPRGSVHSHSLVGLQIDRGRWIMHKFPTPLPPRKIHK